MAMLHSDVPQIYVKSFVFTIIHYCNWSLLYKYAELAIVMNLLGVYNIRADCSYLKQERVRERKLKR